MSEIASTPPGLRLGSTLYAYTNEFGSRQFSFDELLAETARRGLGPDVEVIGYQSFRGFPDLDDATADSFIARMAELGLRPSCLGINADQEIRRGRVASEDEMVAYHEPQMRLAARLGFPVVRYQYGAGPNVIRRLASLAEDLGVKLGLELHAPQHANHPEVMAYREMYAQVNSPALGWIPDFSSTAARVPPSYLESLRQRGVPEDLITLAVEIWNGKGDAQARMMDYRARAEAGNWAPQDIGALLLIFPMFGNADPASWNELMDAVVHIHGKFWGFDADGNEEAIDYGAILPLFRAAGYEGTMSSEWEGHLYSDANAFDLVERHQAMCRAILAA
ncbi:MAG: TIM barrel protein [Novosphingobium sp.]